MCLQFRNPVGVITKGALVERDVERAWNAIEGLCLVRMGHAREGVGLLEAGIRTGVSISPVIPGLNDPQIPEILERAREAGAELAFMIMLRLPAAVRPVFVDRLREALPLRAEHVLSSVRDVRDGELYQAEFGQRMRGAGPRWQAIEALFEAHHRRLGFVDAARFDHVGTTFRRPPANGQLGLFEE